MPVGKERVTEVIDYAMAHGDSRASEVYGLPISTLERYRRKYKEIYGEGADILLALKKRFTDTELKAMLSSSRIKPHEGKPISISENCEILRIGVLSDTHIGHKEFKQEYLYTAFDTMDARGCSMILHSGDVTEGLMNRPGHYYECDQYGYKAQRDEAIRVLSYWKKPIYVSSGNHDNSANSKLGAGIDIVEDICDKIPNAHYLPGDPANITANGIRFRLFHGRDRGGAYAKSYRPQKILDSFGTDIPEVLVVGHAHDADFCKYKGCYIIDAGSIQRETDFMRGNKLSADVGFWVVELHIQNGRIIACSPTWYDLEEIYNGE